jgi:sphingolipid 4-desaturase/C4-monooxygenase
MSEKQQRPLDPRYPLYIGFWKRPISTSFRSYLEQHPEETVSYLKDENSKIFPFLKEDQHTLDQKYHKNAFNFSDLPAIDKFDEPHFKRRLAILKKYPQVLALSGVAHATKYIFLVLLLIQFAAINAFRQDGPLYSLPIWAMLLGAYFIGGTCTQLVGVMLHEATHNLVFEGGNLPNIIFGYFLNLLIFAPVGYGFRRYHLLHHQYQGVLGKDPDLPFPLEYRLVHGNALLKILWIMLYPFMYLFRTFALKLAPTKFEILNWFTCFGWDFFIYRYFGGYAFSYFFISTYFGYSFHVAAAHFIQEHFTWVSGQETYSYYGILNKLFLNIGYHNEHHDFTKVLCCI